MLGYYHCSRCCPFCKSSFFLILLGNRRAPPPAHRAEHFLIAFPCFSDYNNQKEEKQEGDAMRRILTLVLAAVLLSGCVGKKTETQPTVVEEGTVEEVYTFGGGEAG